MLERSAILVAAAAALAGACASAPRQKRDFVWPDPPETARIRFVSAFQSDLDFETGGWASFSRSLFGTRPGVRIVHPMALAVSREGNLVYVADLRGSQVLVADMAKKTLRGFADGQVWQNPAGIAVDRKGNVYVSDARARRVVKLDPSGNLLLAFGRELERPTGLALDEERGLLYVSDSGRQDNDSHRVWAFNYEGKIVREIGNGRGDGDGQFNFPSYLAVDGKGNLYVNDAMNFRIQVFDQDGAFVRAFGEAGAEPGTFSRMKGIDLDSFGNLYVADAEHAVVQMFSPRLELLMYFGGRAPKLELMDMPSAVAIHRPTNRIYVAQELTPRINVYELINTKAEDSFMEPPPPPQAPASRPRPAPAATPEGPTR